MEWYKFGEPKGRYIGFSGKFHIYAESISETPPDMSGLRAKHSKRPEEISFMYGPATGGLLESGGIRLITPGELIMESTVYKDYKRRDLQIRGKSVKDALLMVERINGFHSASHSIAFLSAVEDALGIQVDEEIRLKRIAMLEMERMRSNLEVAKRMLEAGGLGVPVNQIGYLRERVSRVISKAAGHRFFFSVIGVNSALLDLANVPDQIDSIGREFSHIFEGLQDSKIFLNRMQATGIVKNIPMVGPAARGSAVEADARNDSRSLGYQGTGYQMTVRDECDSFARFMVRSEDILNASSIIQKVSETGTQNKGIELEVQGSGEGAARIESPAGDLFYYVKIKDGKVEDVQMVSPSNLNILAFEQSYPGNLVTDFHLNWEGFGVWFAEAGVELI